MDQSLFSFKENKVTLIGSSFEPFFVVEEVCKIIGVKDRRGLYRRIPELYKTTLKEVRGIEPGSITTTPKEFQGKGVTLKQPGSIYWNLPGHTILLTEAGLYYAICTSHGNDCVEFRDWVFMTILPTLRRAGKLELDVVKQAREKTSSLNSQRAKLMEISMGEKNMDGKITVGNVVDELVPGKYRRGFKQKIGILVHKEHPSTDRAVIDTFQQGHNTINMTCFLYDEELKSEIIEIVEKELTDKPTWLLN